MKTVTEYETHIEDIMLYTPDKGGEDIVDIEETEGQEFMLQCKDFDRRILLTLVNFKDQLIKELRKDLIDMQQQIDKLKEGRE